MEPSLLKTRTRMFGCAFATARTELSSPSRSFASIIPWSPPVSVSERASAL